MSIQKTFDFLLILFLFFIIFGCFCYTTDYFNNSSYNLFYNLSFNEKVKEFAKKYKKYEFEKYADKYAVKDIVKKKGYHSPKYVDPMIENSWVCKPNNSCGRVLIVKDGIVTLAIGVKDIIEKGETIEEVRNKLPSIIDLWKNEKYGGGMEVWYKQIPFNLVCEELLLTDEGIVSPDFKLHTFDGKVKLAQIHYGRNTENHKILYTDKNYNFLNNVRVTDSNDIINNKYDMPPKSKNWDKMIKMAEDLGKQFPYVRMDLYEGPCDDSDEPCLGEYTFTPSNANLNIQPEHYNIEFSKYWKIIP